ncbi:amidohydrolase family protein [Shimia isoporae]|nr:amidohydrolase family protein [Shimia isoporae]
MATQLVPDVAIPCSLAEGLRGFVGECHSDCLVGTLLLKGDRIGGLIRGDSTSATKLLFPAPVESHAHLDKCHTIDRMQFTGGDLSAALEAQRADKDNWTEEDLRTRATRGLTEASSAGCKAIRSHVDWGQESSAPLAWSVFLEMAQDTKLHLQLAALTGIDQLADPAFASKVSKQIPSGHALGSFVLNHTRTREGILNAFKTAADRGLALDFHVDETTDPSSNGLEIIADIALETGHKGPILCGHAVSLASQPDEVRKRIIDKLARAGIFIVSLPTTNLYLQGRAGSVPAARGITPINELRDMGVQVVIGTDNVRDAFCPVGRHDPVRALELAVLASHLDPPLDLWLPAITTTAGDAIGLSSPSLQDAPLSEFRIADASDLSILVSGAAHRPATTLLKELTR